MKKLSIEQLKRDRDRFAGYVMICLVLIAVLFIGAAVCRCLCGDGVCVYVLMLLTLFPTFGVAYSQMRYYMCNDELSK